MPRMSPNEDHQTEGATNTNRARRQLTSTGQRQEPFLDDEHPEIPKVKRASLYLNAPPAPPIQTRVIRPARPSRVEEPLEDDWEQEARPSSQTRRARIERTRNNYPEQEETQFSPSTRRPRRDLPKEQAEEDYSERETRLPRRPRQVEQDWDDYSERETRLPRRSHRGQLEEDYRAGDPEPPGRPADTTRRPRPATSSRISVTQHPRPIAYEPKPADYHKPQGRPQRRLQRSERALWAHVQDLTHNRVLLFAGSILIALIIIVPLLSTLSSAHLVTAVQMPGDETGTPGVSSQKGPGIPPDTEHPAPPVYATAAYLLDANTGATLYAHNASMHLPMMSTTKLMTGLLATQYGHLDQKITINDAIANDINQLSADSSVMGAKKGETYTLRELLYGLMLPSGNDAAIAIADAISGSLPKFVALMNQRAQELGLHDTHYENPHGLQDDGHYSSAHDLAVLGKVVMDVPSLREITGTKEYHVPATKEHAEHYFSNSDQFMWWYPGVDGGKIGWDAGANFVQVISCTRNNHHLIGVTLHTIDWWTDMRDLMNWGFNSFTWLSPREINANVHPIPYAADWNYFARDKRENSIPLSNQGRYYVFTGYSVTQPIVGFFDKNGGLGKLGFPISQPQTVNASLQQRFEHGTVQCDQKSKQCKLVSN